MPAISMKVNGKAVSGNVENRTLLFDLSGRYLGLTGTHVGCDTSQCGACVVHIDGKAVKSCTTFAVACEGADVTTIEGIAKNGKLHPCSKLPRESGLQCRLLTPGMINGLHRYREAQWQEGERGSHPPRAFAKHLPLHRLP